MDCANYWIFHFWNGVSFLQFHPVILFPFCVSSSSCSVELKVCGEAVELIKWLWFCCWLRTCILIGFEHIHTYTQARNSAQFRHLKARSKHIGRDRSSPFGSQLSSNKHIPSERFSLHSHTTTHFITCTTPSKPSHKPLHPSSNLSLTSLLLSSTVLVFSGIFTYLVDTYPLYAASALAANSFARSTFGGKIIIPSPSSLSFTADIFLLNSYLPTLWRANVS